SGAVAGLARPAARSAARMARARPRMGSASRTLRTPYATPSVAQAAGRDSPSVGAGLPWSTVFSNRGAIAPRMLGPVALQMEVPSFEPEVAIGANLTCSVYAAIG